MMVEEDYDKAQFTKAEIKGREKYRKINQVFTSGTTWNFTPDKYCPFDVDIKGAGDYVDEIKDRNFYSYEYLDEGYMFEKKKYVNLVNHKQARYVNFFKDDFCFYWYINGMPEPERWDKIKCKRYTVIDSEDIEKDVIYLTFKDAQVVYKNRLLNEDEKKRAYYYLLNKKNNPPMN